MTKKVIWLVDDDLIYHIIMKKIIIKADVCSHINSFHNGKDAMVALKNAIDSNGLLPDLILLDIDMPIMDGWGFMSEWLLLEDRINTKIEIYISSSSIAVEDKLKANNNPAILGYLSKPISTEDLLLLVNKE
jgi:CheY-like chemotaxis protein